MVFSGQNRVKFAVPVDPSQGTCVRKTVRHLLEQVGFPDSVAADVILSVSEAFANAVIHGSGSRWDELHVSVWARRCHVVIELRYPGEPFEIRPPVMPTPDEPTGRGLYLMTTLMDSVSYSFTPGETSVRLEKMIESVWE